MSIQLSFDLPGAAADSLWASFTDPDELVQWWPTAAEVDLRPGGAYILQWPDQGWTLRGRYHTVEPPRLLEFGWAWDHEELPDRRVSIRISEERVEIEHECASDDECTGYRDGWNHFLEVLARRFE